MMISFFFVSAISKMRLSFHVWKGTRECDKRITASAGSSQTDKIGNIGVIAKFVFLYISSFVLNLQHIMLVNVKLDISGCNRITFHIFVNFLCSSTANAKLAILIFLYCGDFVKNPTLAKHRIILYLLALWM